MSGVFVVQEKPTGLWVMGCCDRRCPDATASAHWGEYKTQAIAESVATRHRKLLATMPDEAAWPPKPSCCQTCGQSKTAITDLQDLVRRLELELADARGGDLR